MSETIIIGVVTTFVLFLVLLCGRTIGIKEMEKQAVLHGAAQYTADFEGNVKFQWFYRDQN